MISLPKSLAPVVNAIKDNPNNKNPVLWASWLVPLAVTPLARYVADSERNKSDRLGLSLEMFTLYTIGTILYFTFNPLAGLMTRRLFPQKSELFHNLASGITGSLVSAIFSGFYANRLGDRLRQNLGFLSDPSSKRLDSPTDTKRGLDEISHSPSFGNTSPLRLFPGVSPASPYFSQFISFQQSSSIQAY